MAGLRFQVVTCKRNKGIGSKSNKPYDFQMVGCVMTTAKGTEMVEVMLDGDAPTPKVGETYVPEIEFYPDREKRLAMKVQGFQLAGAPK